MGQPHLGVQTLKAAQARPKGERYPAPQLGCQLKARLCESQLSLGTSFCAHEVTGVTNKAQPTHFGLILFVWSDIEK